jgi:hypothetical protein
VVFFVTEFHKLLEELEEANKKLAKANDKWYRGRKRRNKLSAKYLNRLKNQCRFLKKEISKIILRNQKGCEYLSFRREGAIVHIFYGHKPLTNQRHGHCIFDETRGRIFYDRPPNKPHGYQNYIY